MGSDNALSEDSLSHRNLLNRCAYLLNAEAWWIWIFSESPHLTVEYSVDEVSIYPKEGYGAIDGIKVCPLVFRRAPDRRLQCKVYR